MTPARPILAAALAAALARPAVCAPEEPARPTASRRTVSVAAASDLQFAFDEVADALRAERPDLDVTVTYGSSGSFFAQIGSGAPFDLFLSADAEYPRRLQKEGLAIAGSVFLYGRGRLVLWVPNGSPVDVDGGLPALSSPAVRRVAIANPRHAPYGRAAEAALRTLGLWDAVKEKLVLGENVAQASQFVTSGSADAGILALSLALAPPLRQKGRFREVPEKSYPVLEQAGVIVKGAHDVDGARAVQSFLAGPRAREILKRHGFTLPGE